MFAFSQRSLSRLEGIHPDLRALTDRALVLTTVDFGVSEGLRTIEKQREYLRRGSSTTLRSRHLTGHAVDVFAYVDGAVSWEWPFYHDISKAFFQASEEVGVPVEWGGNWTTFKDGPHFQLPWASYPAESDADDAEVSSSGATTGGASAKGSSAGESAAEVLTGLSKICAIWRRMRAKKRSSA